MVVPPVPMHRRGVGFENGLAYTCALKGKLSGIDVASGVTGGLKALPGNQRVSSKEEDALTPPNFF